MDSYLLIFDLLKDDPIKMIRVLFLRRLFLVIPIKKSHMRINGSFSKDVIKKHCEEMCLSIEEALEDFAVCMGIYEYELRLIYDGLGGCEARSFEDCLELYRSSDEYKKLCEELKNEQK